GAAGEYEKSLFVDGRARVGARISRRAARGCDRTEVINGQTRRCGSDRGERTATGGRAGGRDAGGSGRHAAGDKAGRYRIVTLAEPPVRSEPGDIWIGRTCVGKARQIGRRGERNADRDSADGVPCILQPPGTGDHTSSVRPRRKAQCGRVARTSRAKALTPLAE